MPIMTLRRVATLVVATATIFVASHVPLSNATIIVISKTSNETVFSAEEIGIDAASAYDLRGNLILADPIDACSEVKPPPTRNHTIVIATITGQHLSRRDSWILWATYNYSGDACSLSRKAKEAEYAGYSAIVITVFGTNDTAGILPSFMGFDWMGVRIYTSILGETMGNGLKRYAYPNPNSTNYYIEFENEPYFQLGLLANFIFLGCLGILIVVILLRLFHCLYMRVSSTVQERRRKRKAYLTEAQLRKLPVLHWRTSIPQDTCSICIETFCVGEEIRVLPCSHVFHKPCIDPWLIHSSRRCPNCKGKVIFPNEHLSDSSNSDSDSNMEDSDDDGFGGGNERTPLLRGNASDSDDQMEDTRFIETVAHSNPGRGGDSSRSNSLVMDQTFRSRGSGSGPANSEAATACLIDISSDSEQDSFGFFQSARTVSAGGNKSGNETAGLFDDDDCSLSLRSAKSLDSDKTYVGEKEGQSSRPTATKKPDERTSFGSSASFFSCLESELEKSASSSSTNNNELFQSFS